MSNGWGQGVETMMSFEALQSQILRGTKTDACLEELRDALLGLRLVPVGAGPGRLSARKTISTYERRARTTREAGIDTCGFEPTLARLRRLPPEDTVLLYGFADSDRVFVVFMWEMQETIVGCLRVVRGNAPPSLKKQGLAQPSHTS